MNKQTVGSSVDEALDALADVRRRTLLVSLLEHNPQDEKPTIADSVDGQEPVVRLIDMKHVHLPKLVDYGFIEWDEDTHEVSKGPDFDEIRPLLELLEDHENELPPGWL